MAIESRALYKTIIVIWTDYYPVNMDIEYLSREATTGEAYCSRQETLVVQINDLDQDPDWDGNEFFNLDEDGSVE